MGRRSWDDPKLPKPLPNRTVYVATSRPMNQGDALIVKGDLEEEIVKIKQSYPFKTVWVVGGADILAQCKDLYDRIYLTHFKGAYKIDTKVDMRSILSGYRMVSASAAPQEKCTFVVYESIFKRNR